ncbi:MAG: hypothetical protein GXP56_15520, partial [Deltaproteobacteria bacterium]|nr:hypothetical protein [Deltaproteobacteria bacterium]
MSKKIVYGIFIFVLFLSLFSGLAQANGLQSLFKQVKKLKIERNGYVLGAALNREQIKTAKANQVAAGSKGTFKFKDRNLFIVARKKTNQVIVI